MTESLLDRMRARDAQLAEERKRLAPVPNEPTRLDKIMAELTSPEFQAGLREREERDKARQEAEERERREAREAHEREQAPLREALQTCQAQAALERVPPAIRNLVTGDAFKLSLKTVVVSRAWAKGERRGLILRGGVGTGKSVAAACALAEHAQGKDFGCDVSWHRPNDFVSGVIHAYDAKAPKIAKGMVVVDDLGRETKADFEEALVQLIDDTLTRFVITTNLTREEMVTRYGERLIDRLDAECLTVATSGKSMRGGAK